MKVWNIDYYYELFNSNDKAIFPTFISNAGAVDFLLANAPRLYCPDALIEETFAFRTWTMRKYLKKIEYVPPHRGGKERGRDYNHSTFIDLVLRGLCRIDDSGQTLTVCPKIGGIWKWFKLENLTFRKKTYTVYYDEDGSHFGKGKGITLEKM